MTMTKTWIDAVVVSRAAAASDIAVFELASADDVALPDYAAGAHIDVLLDDGRMIRQYSLCDPPGSGRYRLAVLNDPNSRGGSRAMHELRVGDKVEISAPRNRFPLATADRHLLFAGGIGITPLLAMSKTLDAEGGDYALHYCARSRAAAAFASELAENPRITLHFDDADSGLLDVDGVLGLPSPDTAVYVCGPGGFMDHVLSRAEAMGWPSAALHKERFTSSVTDTDAGKPGAFTVRVASTGAEYQVSENETVLDVLLENGIDAPSSCQQGICGECIVRVLGGKPDHRDDVLTEDEKEEGYFTTCSSRAHSPVLELDL